MEYTLKTLRIQRDFDTIQIIFIITANAFSNRTALSSSTSNLTMKYTFLSE
jgi:hypothetical protein